MSEDSGQIKVALVTGASRGLGREIALMLGRTGFGVAVNFRSDEAHATEVAARIGLNALLIRADVGDSLEVEDMARLIKERWGRLDVLINNAGITRDSLLVKQSEADWDAVIRTNLKGCFNTARALAPLLISSGGGHIVNVSSYSGLRGKKGQAAYAASKSALIGFTYALASELGRYNIRVNAVLPGYMQTAMGISAPEAMARAKADSMLGRLSNPAEVAGFIAWLIGAGNITGEVFTIDSRGHAF